MNDIQIAGGFDLDIDVPSATEFTGNIDGALTGNMVLGQLETFDLTSNGACGIKISGETKKSVISLNGAGTIDAFDLHTIDSDITINGAGTGNIYTTGILNAEITGVGTITYDGNPETVNSNADITGSIKAR